MQTTNNTVRRFGFIILHEYRLTDFFFKFSLIERFKKITARIIKDMRLYDYNSIYRSLNYIHLPIHFLIKISFQTQYS